jgi:hypothetical protein
MRQRWIWSCNLNLGNIPNIISSKPFTHERPSPTSSRLRSGLNLHSRILLACSNLTYPQQQHRVGDNGAGRLGEGARGAEGGQV